MTDPFAVLGLPRTATAAEVLAARRRLAKQLHPDALGHGEEGDRRAAERRLAEVNRAVELALAAIAMADVEAEAGAGAASVDNPVDNPVADARGDQPPPVVVSGARSSSSSLSAGGVSFAIDALPVEAFELVWLALSAIGDPKVVDEPYLLEGLVDDPSLCLCRIELVPEAGGSLVTVEVAPMARSPHPPPSPADVAGRLMAEIEVLGRC